MSYGSDEVNDVEDKGGDSLVSPKKMTSQDLCNLAKERQQDPVMGLKRKKQINEKRRKSILSGGPSPGLGPGPSLGPRRGTRKSDSIIFSESHDDSDEESKGDSALK